MIDLKSYLFKIDVRAQKDEEKVFMRTAWADEPSILTLVERQTRYASNVYLAGKRAELVNQAVQELYSSIRLHPLQLIMALNLPISANLKGLTFILPTLTPLMREAPTKTSTVSFENLFLKDNRLRR